MILITGGGGFIGLHIARELLNCDRKVLLMGRSPIQLPSFLKDFPPERIRTVSADIRDREALEAIVKEHKVESIVHGAAVYEPVDLHTTLEINLDGTREVLEVAQRTGLRRVTFLSSVGVYFGSDSKDCYREDATLGAVAPYGYIDATKKAAEQICLLYQKAYGMSVVITRPPLVWGPLHHDGPGMALIHGVIEKAFAGETADYSDHYGPAKLVLCYVRDCARAIRLLHLAPTLNHAIYNFSDGRNTSLKDLAEATKRQIPDAEVRFRQTRNPHDLELLPYDLSRIHTDVGYAPEYDADRAVGAYLDWLRDSTYS